MELICESKSEILQFTLVVDLFQKIFASLLTIDKDLYFMCGLEDFIEVSKLLANIDLNLRTRYTFCTAPINRKEPFNTTIFAHVNIVYASNLTLSHSV